MAVGSASHAGARPGQRVKPRVARATCLQAIRSLVVVLSAWGAEAPADEPGLATLARSYVLDVPFLVQREHLCGGAAAAMVLRYWGEREVGSEDFAGLVDSASGGIRVEDLVSSLGREGWNVRVRWNGRMPMRSRLPTSSITWLAGCITSQRSAGISTCS
jgi:hypothetical protein